MENKITFDYSKAVNVVREEEVAAMEKMVETAKEVGLIFLLIMIKKNLIELKKLRTKLKMIQMYFL